MCPDNAIVPAVRPAHAGWLRLALSIFLLAGITGAVRICTVPLDVSGTVQSPTVVASAKGNDAIAYPAHLALATLLEAFECSPLATGVQWLKAAAHADSAAEVTRAADGLAAARERGGVDVPLQAVLCEFLRGRSVNTSQASAMAQAEISCGGRLAAP